MTKKYAVESSTIVRKMLGRLPCSNDQVLKLTQMITKKIMESENEAHAE
jgi:hypothetical protein